MDQFLDYVSGRRLMERWNKTSYEVFQIIKNSRLQEYVRDGDKCRRITPLRAEIDDLLYNGDEKVSEQALASRYFSVADIEKLENRIGINKGTQVLKAKPTPTKKKREASPEVKALVKKARPEIENIYSAIKEVGFSGRETNAVEKWKNAALERFDNCKDEIKTIKREYLEDDDLYAFSPGQERRDFLGGILKKIVKGFGHRDFGANCLRNIYKS